MCLNTKRPLYTTHNIKSRKLKKFQLERKIIESKILKIPICHFKCQNRYNYSSKLKELNFLKELFKNIFTN